MTVGQVAAGGPGRGAVGRVLDPAAATDPDGHDLPAARMFVGLTWHVILATGLTLALGR